VACLQLVLVSCSHCNLRTTFIDDLARGLETILVNLNII